MTPRHKVIVFDLDDTLYKEIDFLKSGFRYIASLVSDENAPADEIFRLMLDTYREGGNAFETAVKEYGLRLYDVQWMIGVYRNHRPDISLDEDTRETLGWLKAKGVTMGIITDGRRETQMNKVRALGLLDYMREDDVIINETPERFKPDETSFRQMMDKYGKDCDYIYVGDNTEKDFIAPKALGWTTVCLLDDGRNIHRQDLASPAASSTICLISEITNMSL